MSINEFWNIIDEANEAGSEMELKCERLGIELRKLTAAEAKSFQIRMIQCWSRMLTWKVVAAGSIIFDDEFERHLPKLIFNVISKGRAVYENALKLPDSLAAFSFDNLGFFDALFGMMATFVYEEKTKTECGVAIPQNSKPSGGKIAFENIRKELPLLAAKYKKVSWEPAPWPFASSPVPPQPKTPKLGDPNQIEMKPDDIESI